MQQLQGVSVAELLRDDLSAGTGRLLRHEAAVRRGEDPEAVHQARVATRRLRSTLRTFSGLLEPAWSGRLRSELQWLAGLLGAVRDADVLHQRLEADLDGLPAADAGRGRRLLRGLAEQRAGDHARLLTAMGEPRYAALREDLVAAAASPALLPGAERPAAEVLPALVARPWRRLAKAVRQAGPDPDDGELHQVRIRAKRARYAAEAAVAAVGEDARRFAKACEALQEVLGDQHDAVVAAAWLQAAAAATGGEDALAAGRLIAAERARAATARAAWRPLWDALDRGELRSWLG